MSGLVAAVRCVSVSVRVTAVSIAVSVCVVVGVWLFAIGVRVSVVSLKWTAFWNIRISPVDGSNFPFFRLFNLFPPFFFGLRVSGNKQVNKQTGITAEAYTTCCDQGVYVRSCFWNQSQYLAICDVCASHRKVKIRLV
jgi:hypothetical protein